MAIDPRHTSLPKRPTTPPSTNPSTPPSTISPTKATTPPSTNTHPQSDGDRKQLAQSTDKSPIHTSTTSSKGNARGALLAHLSEARLTTEQRHFLRTAFKELDKPNADLVEHLALRDLAKEHGVQAAFDEILAKHSSTLLPQLLERANVFAGASELRNLGEIATAMNARDAFDVHVSEQLTVARSWAKSDADRAEVEQMATSLGLSFVPEESRSEKPKRIVTEEIDAVKKSRRLITKNPLSWEGYQKVLDMLAKGEAGKNQHALSGDLAGLWAADLPHSGAGRGAMRILYEINDDRVVIRDLVDYH